MHDTRNRPLRVAELIATKPADEVRGPGVIMHTRDAADRLLNDGELAWVYGPRRHELAQVILDDRVKKGDVILRDVVGSAPSEWVRVIKPDLDTRGKTFLA